VTPGFNYAHALARDADGKLVVASEVGFTGFGVLRYGRSTSPCRSARVRGSTLSLVDPPDAARASLTWKWKGAAVSAEDLGGPTESTRYTACLRVGERRQRFALRGSWEARGAGYALRNRDRASATDGIIRATLRAGGRAQVRVSARGPNVPALLLPLTSPVTFRLSREDADVCWDAVFDTHVSRNDPGRFRATSD
jgi:hypothetical protein